MEKLSDYVDGFRDSVEIGLRAIADRVASKRTQKMALNSFIFVSCLATLLATAIAVYILFYIVYMPQVATTHRLYLDYTAVPPSSSLDLSGFLKPSRHYDFALLLVIPDSEHNFNLGNFMAVLQLKDERNRTTAESHRPALVRYKSPLLRRLGTYANALWYLSSAGLESQEFAVELLDNYEEKQNLRVSKAIVSLSESRLQTYETLLRIETNYQGLIFFMYHWWLSTAALFVMLIMLSEVVLLASVWRIVAALVPQPRLRQPVSLDCASRTNSISSSDSVTRHNLMDSDKSSAASTKRDNSDNVVPSIDASTD